MSSINARVPPLRLMAVDTPADGEVAAYQSSSGKFQWVSSGGGGDTYSIAAAQTGSDAEIQLDAATGTDSAVKLAAGSNVTLTESGGDTITIASTQASAANPTATVSGTATNGSASTFMRSDASPALADTTVSAGSYTYSSITVDAQGRLTAASSGAAPAVDGSGAATQVTYWSDADTITGSNNLTFDGTNLDVAGYVKAGTIYIGNGSGQVETVGAVDLTLQTNEGTNSGSLTIKSGVSGNAIFQPNGTGAFQFNGVSGGEDGRIMLMCSEGTHSQTISAAPHASASTYELVLPTGLPADADNKYLVSDTSGNMSFTTASGGGSSGPPLSAVTYPDGLNWYGSQNFQRYRINSLPPYGTKGITNTSYTSSTDYDGTFYFPFYAPQTGTVDALSFNIITAASAGNLEVGVYSAGSGTNQYPATLLGKGSVSITSGGSKSITSFTTGGGVSTTINVTQGTLYYIGYCRTTSGEAYNVYGSQDLYSASSGINLGQAEQYVSLGGILRSYATETAVPSSISSGSPTWDDFTVGNASWRRIVFNIEIGV